METYMPFVWVGFALFALLVEAGTSQLISIWFSLGAFGGAICCIFTDNIIIQVFVFIIITTLSLVITRPLVKKFKQKNGEVKTNLDRVIGCEATLTKDITKDNPGELKVLGDYWSVISSDGNEVKSGTRVKVLEIKGTKLVVEKVYSLVK